MLYQLSYDPLNPDEPDSRAPTYRIRAVAQLRSAPEPSAGSIEA